jgi:hypothetical protein
MACSGADLLFTQFLIYSNKVVFLPLQYKFITPVIYPRQNVWVLSENIKNY